MALLEVKNLHTYFKTRKGIVKAVNDVSYSLDEKRTIGMSESPDPERAFLR